MPRATRGILGVKKDPKNQILFSFQAREGEEWPSSDSDSDYCPNDEHGEGTSASTTSPKRKGVKNKPKGKRTKKQSKTNGTSPKKAKSVETTYSGPEVTLPTEIWLKIFQNIVNKDGAFPFLLRAAKVCRKWQDISTHSSLWHTVDLAYGWIKLTDKKFKWLCTKRLKECSSLNLSNTKIVGSQQAITELTTHCQNLRTLNLSLCKKLTGETVNKIVSHCKNLERIDLSSTSPDAVSSQTLTCIAEQCAGRLKGLNVANNLLKGFNIVFKKLMDICPCLEFLELSFVKLSAGFISIDIEQFQRACPKMRTIRLVDTPFRFTNATVAQKEASVGFPELREASLAVNPTEAVTTIVPDIITRLLKNATKLQVIDLRGSRNHQVFHCLEELAAENLSQLYLSRSAVSTYGRLRELISKWSHSLVDIDLSWNQYSADNLTQGLKALIEGRGPSRLEVLNVAGTSVTLDIVKELLPNLPNLRDLDLTSCRDMPRGCKRQYKSPEQILNLNRSPDNKVIELI